MCKAHDRCDKHKDEILKEIKERVLTIKSLNFHSKSFDKDTHIECEAILRLLNNK